MSARMTEISDLKHQLDSSSSEQSRLTELNVQQQASIDSLQQQLVQLTTQHRATEEQLNDSKTLVSQLQVSAIIIIIIVVYYAKMAADKNM